jgi:Uma2 family endonuclease
VRAPDLAFVRKERHVNTDHYFPGPPDLAVEVISPSDSYSEVFEKTREYLAAGTLAVVIVDPRTEAIEVRRRSGTVAIADTLEVDDVVPGWKMPLAEIFGE